MRVLGVRDRQITALRPEECIACHCCKGSCPAGLDTIDIETLGPLEEIPRMPLQPIWNGLAITLGPLSLRSPLIVASGPIGRCAYGWIKAMASGCGAVVTKTNTPVPWPGNPAIRILFHGQDSLLNSEGLPNRGMEATANDLKQVKRFHPGLVLIPSLSAQTNEEFVQMARLFEDAGADALEIPLMGCPNYRPGAPITKGPGFNEPAEAFRLIKAIRKSTHIPIWVKVGQNVANGLAAEEAGADSLLVRFDSLRVTALDPSTGKPLLSQIRGEGMLTGPYSRLIGLRIVAEIASQVRIPIIANGGVFSGQDVIDYIRAGATAVELLTSIIRRGMSVIPKILSEIETSLKKEKKNSLKEIRGESLHYISPRIERQERR